MPERHRYDFATVAAEAMYTLIEAEYQQGERDPDAMMRRLKDLSAYSLTHAEIMTQREGVELLALGMFFGMTSQPGFHANQERLQGLSEGVLAYEGQAEVVEQEIAARKWRERQQDEDDETDGLQPRLL